MMGMSTKRLEEIRDELLNNKYFITELDPIMGICNDLKTLIDTRNRIDTEDRESQETR